MVTPECTELGIKTIPKENTRVTTSSIKIQNIQNVETDVPSEYGKSIIVPSTDFQKMCKELSSIGSTNIRVEAHECYIDFIADNDDILKRSVRLGESDSDSEDNTRDCYTATFTTDQFTRIQKIAGLGTKLQIYAGSPDLPLMFRSNVGTIGKISIYIKSRELSEKELTELSNDSDDSDNDSEDGAEE